MAVDGFSDRLTRYLGYRSIRRDATRASSWIELRADLLDGAGRIELGALAYLIDSTAGVACGMAAVPAWVITADLQFHVIADATVGPLRADATAVSPGRRQSLGSVQVVDEGASDRPVAIGSVNHLVIQPDSTLDVPADMPIGVEYASGLDVTSYVPLVEHLGLRCPESGVAEIPVEGDAVNPLGILHGALISLLVDHAARGAVADERFEVVDVVVRFLKGLRTSPAVARATIVDDRTDTRCATVEVRDGAGVLGALASVVLRPAPG
jgi:acyl-coenzyme A thioesterase PaaI-like protein